MKNKVTESGSISIISCLWFSLIQRRLNLTDRELVEQIAENPYTGTSLDIRIPQRKAV